MSTPAILLLVFRRADLVRLQITALRPFQPPRLYVAADGPRECNPRDPPRLRLSKQTMIVRITTDHYNQGKGTDYTGTISIRDNNGKEVGRFSTHGKPGKNGAANSYWVAEPGKILPAGMYYIWDSNLPTWSKKSTGEAFILVEGYETE